MITITNIEQQSVYKWYREGINSWETLTVKARIKNWNKSNDKLRHDKWITDKKEDKYITTVLNQTSVHHNRFNYHRYWKRSQKRIQVTPRHPTMSQLDTRTMAVTNDQQKNFTDSNFVASVTLITVKLCKDKWCNNS